MSLEVSFESLETHPVCSSCLDGNSPLLFLPPCLAPAAVMEAYPPEPWNDKPKSVLLPVGLPWS